MISSSSSCGTALVERTGVSNHRCGGLTERVGKIVLVSFPVMHYRVSVYNYFHKRFRDYGFEFSVISNRLQKQNQNAPQFEFQELPYGMFAYRRALIAAQPLAVLISLHMKDWIIWPLIHWLKLSRIPFAFWTKGGNWDAKDSKVSRSLYRYVNGISDALILYGESCREFLRPECQSKVFVANNTVNFEDYPAVQQTKEEIKREFGIPFEKTVIFMGRMGEQNGRKRVNHLIETFRGLDRRDIGLVLVGSGLSDQLKRSMNRKNTMYLGEVHDPQNLKISKLCKMADLCAIPGHLGLSVNQAFYWGLPVVTEEGEDHPPERFYLKPGRNGLMVSRNNVPALRDGILSLLDNDKMRAEFSQHAREDILREASIEGMFSAFKACVDYLIRKNPQGRS